LTPSPESRKNEEGRGSPPGSFDGGGGRKKAKKESLFGITKPDDTKRSAVSSVNTSTQGGSSSSRTRVVLPVVLSETVDKGPKNREITESPKGESFSLGEKSQGVSIHESVKEVIGPILKQLIYRHLKSGVIFNRDGVPQEGETAARQTERERQDALNLWEEEREVPVWFVELIAKIRQKQTKGENVVEELHYKTNLVMEQRREIQRLKEQNDALRQARNQAAARSQHTREYSGKRRDSSGQKEDGGGKYRESISQDESQGSARIGFGEEEGSIARVHPRQGGTEFGRG
jgi:hypothetical protein